jgi:hypothetical protein
VMAREGSPAMPAPPADAPLLPASSHVRAAWPTGRQSPVRLLSVVVSITALVVSIIVFFDQRNMARRVSVADRQAYADQVSYWIMPAAGKPHVETLFVQNRGETPISRIMLGLPAISPKAEAAVSAGAGFSTIPPCTTLKVDLQSTIAGAARLSKPTLRFTDVNGHKGCARR